MQTFRKNLLYLIEKAGGREQLGALTGISAWTLHVWAKGGVNPRLGTVDRLAAALGLPIDDLVNVDLAAEGLPQEVEHRLKALSRLRHGGEAKEGGTE